jgi:hypothetical protein
MEKIEVAYKYTEIQDTNGVKYYHKLIIYTDNNGIEWFARGGPSIDRGLTTINWNQPLGSIVTSTGEYIRWPPWRMSRTLF